MALSWGNPLRRFHVELRTRKVRLGLVWVDRNRPLDLEERLLFQGGIGVVVEKLLRVSAGEHGARQREVRIMSHCPFELLDCRHQTGSRSSHPSWWTNVP